MYRPPFAFLSPLSISPDTSHKMRWVTDLIVLRPRSVQESKPVWRVRLGVQTRKVPQGGDVLLTSFMTHNFLCHVVDPARGRGVCCERAAWEEGSVRVKSPASIDAAGPDTGSRSRQPSRSDRKASGRGMAPSFTKPPALTGSIGKC